MLLAVKHFHSCINDLAKNTKEILISKKSISNWIPFLISFYLYQQHQISVQKFRDWKVTWSTRWRATFMIDHNNFKCIFNLCSSGIKLLHENDFVMHTYDLLIWDAVQPLVDAYSCMPDNFKTMPSTLLFPRIDERHLWLVKYFRVVFSLQLIITGISDMGTLLKVSTHDTFLMYILRRRVNGQNSK